MTKYWTIDELRAIAEGRWRDMNWKYGESGQLIWLRYSKPVYSKTAARQALEMIEKIEMNEKERALVQAKIDRSQRKIDRALDASDRIAHRLSKLRAKAVAGVKAKLKVLRESDYGDYDEITARILEDVELVSA